MKGIIIVILMVVVAACSGTDIKPVDEAVRIMQIKEHREAALQMALRYFVTGELSKEKIEKRCISCHPELSEQKNVTQQIDV